MGTDIHTAMQQRSKDGTWKTVAKELYDGRNYEMFGVFAGVRSFESDPIIEPQGFYPPDSGVFLRPLEDSTLKIFPDYKEYYIEDYWLGTHDFGWIQMDTYFSKKVGLETGMLLAPLTQKFRDLMEEHADMDEVMDYSNFRVLFGFDS